MFLMLTLRSCGCCLDPRSRFPQKLGANTGFAVIALERDRGRSLTALKPRVDRPAGAFEDY
jgi:hypothetical protein